MRARCWLAGRVLGVARRRSPGTGAARAAAARAPGGRPGAGPDAGGPGGLDQGGPGRRRLGSDRARSRGRTAARRQRAPAPARDRDPARARHREEAALAGGARHRRGPGCGHGVRRSTSIPCAASSTTTTPCSRGEAVAVDGRTSGGVGAGIGALVKTDVWTPVALDALGPPPARVGRAGPGSRASRRRIARPVGPLLRRRDAMAIARSAARGKSLALVVGLRCCPARARPRATRRAASRRCPRT